MKEWFLSSEVSELGETAISRQAIAKKAKKNNWIKRKAQGMGRAFEYHISSFHEIEQKQLIGIYGTESEKANIQDTIAQLKELAAQHTGVAPEPSNVTEISNIKEVKDFYSANDLCAVPVYNVYASCGFGMQNDVEYQLRTEYLPCYQLKRFGLTEKTARIIICHGDSMEDTLSDGDEVLIDTRELEHPVKHGVYVVRIGKHVYIKRLRYDIMAESYEVISDNKEIYPSFIVDDEKLDEFAVIGKVVTTVMKAVV